MELWERKCPVILPKSRLPPKFRDLLHAANLRHGTDGFTSPPKDFFFALKRRFRPGLNPRTWVLKASTLSLDHRSRCFIYIYIHIHTHTHTHTYIHTYMHTYMGPCIVNRTTEQGASLKSINKCQSISITQLFRVFKLLKRENKEETCSAARYAELCSRQGNDK